MRPVPNDLSSASAAELLGISRPALMKIVAAGELASRKVGEHHRFAHQDVITLASRRREKQQSAFNELRSLDGELGTEE